MPELQLSALVLGGTLAALALFAFQRAARRVAVNTPEPAYSAERWRQGLATAPVLSSGSVHPERILIPECLPRVNTSSKLLYRGVQ